MLDAKGNTMRYEYNPLGQLSRKVDQLGFAITRTYDDNGNVATETDANGNVKTYTYDTLNQLVRKALPDNVIDLAYDVRGNMSSAQNAETAIAMQYDVAGRLESVTTSGRGAQASLPAATLGFSFDDNGNRVQMTHGNSSVAYAYDALDRLTALTNHKGETFSFSFDAINRITQMNRPGSYTQFAFDDRNFVTSIVHKATSTGAALANFGYALDAIGNRTQVATARGNFDYGYDQNNQLTSATNPDVAGLNQAQLANRAPSGMNAETFNYDQIYNRTTDQAGSYTYDNKSQRLTEDYRNFYFYDNNGNLISKQVKGLNGETTNFEYSSENQLKKFKVFDPTYSSTSPAKEVTYVYDAMGRRVAKKVVDYRSPSDALKTFERRYVYDGQEIIAEYDGANALLARYTHSTLRTDDVLAVDVTSSGQSAQLAQSTGSYHYIKDAQGTVTDVTNSVGAVVQHYVYSSFGALLGVTDALASDITSSPVVRTSYTYTGREYDSESGYYYYRARYYDAWSGRFLQKDPYAGKMIFPATVGNSYSYVTNEPISLTDPDGKFIFVAAFIYLAVTASTTTILAAAATGAALGAIGFLASIEAQHGFDPMSTYDAANADPMKFLKGLSFSASLGAIGGGVGAQLSNWTNAALGISTSMKGAEGVLASGIEGGLFGAFSSAGATAGAKLGMDEKYLARDVGIAAGAGLVFGFGGGAIGHAIKDMHPALKIIAIKRELGLWVGMELRPEQKE